MPFITTLGPANTFSQLAAEHYASHTGGDYSVKLYPTLTRAFAAMSAGCEYGLFPIENMIEGYVPVVLDMLVHSQYSIIDEMLLPIQFSLVANCKTTEAIEKIYAQFITRGQCEKCIDSLPSASVITTQSNGMSFEQVSNAVDNEAAIVPAHTVKPGDFPLVIENIADYQNNQTRFIVISKTLAEYDPERSYKTSLLIFEGTDKPGVLSNILTAFSSREINLVSIMSRPTKEMFGRYHFFIDIEGHHSDPNIQQAMDEIKKENTVRMLGSYPKAVSVTEIKSKQKTVIPPTPFDCNPSRPSVYCASSAGPYNNTRKALANLDLSCVKNKRVLLKPNAGRCAKPGSGITTHPQVVAAAIDAFTEAGGEVAIGESPITGVKAMDAFESTGIKAVADERNCPLIDMDARKFVPFDIDEGIAINSLKICPEITEFDIVVSIPVMKTHMHTGVTLSVKNMKGCLWRRSKVDLHMLPEQPGIDEKPLDIAIADMATVLLPHLSIIDGTVGMEGLGPSAGNPKPMDVVIVGVDPLAADSVACELMGISASDIPHLRMSAERNCRLIDLKSIEVTPDNYAEMKSDFAPPPDKLSIEFAGYDVRDKQSCSACQSTLLMFLKQYGKELHEKRKDENDVVIAIGKGHEDLPPGTLCIGNCTAKHKDCGTFISGCPPVASEILKAYYEYYK